VLLGIGLGGFVDGIVLHQILQWHHMLTRAGYPRATVGTYQSGEDIKAVDSQVPPPLPRDRLARCSDLIFCDVARRVTDGLKITAECLQRVPFVRDLPRGANTETPKERQGRTPAVKSML
jgi:CheY-like chemotaxis protein